jgi:glycosyltransferase involved in cell wall biosynthesis
MMMRRRIVAANVGAVSERVEERRRRFLLPALDPAALFDAILCLAANPSLQASMGARGRESAIALCSVEKCARIHVEAYDRALAHYRGYARTTKRRFARTMKP